MKGLDVKCISFERTNAIVGLINLTFNMFSYEQVMILLGITAPSKAELINI